MLILLWSQKNQIRVSGNFDIEVILLLLQLSLIKEHESNVSGNVVILFPSQSKHANVSGKSSGNKEILLPEISKQYKLGNLLGTCVSLLFDIFKN